MKKIALFLSLCTVIGALVAGCKDVRTNSTKAAEITAELRDNYFGARFKEGKGVELSPEMKG